MGWLKRLLISGSFFPHLIWHNFNIIFYYQTCLNYNIYNAVLGVVILNKSNNLYIFFVWIFFIISWALSLLYSHFLFSSSFIFSFLLLLIIYLITTFSSYYFCYPIIITFFFLSHEEIKVYLLNFKKK